VVLALGELNEDPLVDVEEDRLVDAEGEGDCEVLLEMLLEALVVDAPLVDGEEVGQAVSGPYCTIK
jgi:hypothetical protein